MFGQVLKHFGIHGLSDLRGQVLLAILPEALVSLHSVLMLISDLVGLLLRSRLRHVFLKLVNRKVSLDGRVIGVGYAALFMVRFSTGRRIVQASIHLKRGVAVISASGTNIPLGDQTAVVLDDGFVGL